MTSVDQEIFPLPLTLVEKYFLLDSTADYPMGIVGKFVLTGNLDRDHFERAVQKSLKSHPLFLRKTEKRLGSLFWSRASSPLNILWSDTLADGFLPDADEALALENYPLFVKVERTDSSAVIHFHCHHARCDGVGVYRFWGDVFSAYAAFQGQSVGEATPIELRKILERDKFQDKDLPEKMGFFRIVWENIKGVGQWLSVRPKALGRNRSPLPEGEIRFGKTTFHISRETNDRLRRYAKRCSVRLNDLFLALLYRAIARWQLDLFESKGNEDLRINVPVNMRWKGCDAIPATNIIGYAFLTRKIKNCLSDRHRLLDSIHDEMQIIKDWHVGLMFLDALAFFNRIPGGLRRMVRSKNCLASLVFSNVGMIERLLGHDFQKSDDQKLLFGNMCLDTLESFAPCRNKTRLTIVLATFAEQITLCCNYERQFISDEQMQLLLRYYDDEQTDLLKEEGKCDD